MSMPYAGDSTPGISMLRAVVFALCTGSLAFAQGESDTSTYPIQDTYEITDFMPLEVGNSWTYLQVIHSSLRGAGPFPSEAREFTISILRTEVIDGHTYYLFSEAPPDSTRPLPGQSLSGRKLRWDGDNLVQHDGASAVALYRFSPGSDSEISLRYAIPPTNGDTMILRIVVHTSRSDIPKADFHFFGPHTTYGSHDIDCRPPDGLCFGRGVTFVAGYGMSEAGERGAQGDGIIFINELYPIRAVLHEGGTARTVEWEDVLRALMGIAPRPQDASQAGISSWGAIKESSK